MVNKFGKVMIYVKDPRTVADFWIQKVDFIEIQENKNDAKTISVEVAPSDHCDASIVLFDREIVAKMSPELSLGTPSILLSSFDVEAMRATLIERGVTVGEVVTMQNQKTFNFCDNEDNYFAVAEITK